LEFRKKQIPRPEGSGLGMTIKTGLTSHSPLFLMIHVLRETHEAPPEIQRRIARAGGYNRFGEPNFRVVWGWSRLSWIGGRWTDRDAHGNVLREQIELRYVPKYIPHDRWHIERWMPPESYGSPETWSSATLETADGIRVPALGPFPRRGEYEHCFTLQGPHGEFIPLSPAACDAIVRAIVWAPLQRPQDLRAALDAREQRRDRAWNDWADAALS
jgi:hypothetical protein